MFRREYDPHRDGPLYRFVCRRKNLRGVTVPERVGPHVKLAFAEMRRQLRTYDEVEAASGVRRPTVKQWRKKNAPGLESLTAVLNCLGWAFVAVPVCVEPLPAKLASKIAEVGATARMEMGDVWSAAVLSAARQLIACEGSARILAEIDAERAALPEPRYRPRKPKVASNDNVKQSADAAA
jgi:hypothetical protein